MRKSIFFYKELTPAEVGKTGTHEIYIRLPNNFDYETFFCHSAVENGPVIEVTFTAEDITNGGDELTTLRFVYFKNSNKEKRIPSLGPIFKKHNVQEGDVVCLESRIDGANVSYFLCFYEKGEIQVNPAAIYFTRIENGQTKVISNIPINQSLQQIFYGAPGTGKSFAIKNIIDKDAVIRTTFHPDSDYSTFVGAYKPVMEEKKVQVVPIVMTSGISLEQNKGTYLEKRISYKFVKQAFLKAYLSAWKKYAAGSISSISSSQANGVTITNTSGTDKWVLYKIDNDFVYFVKESCIEKDRFEKLIKSCWNIIKENPDEYRPGTNDYYQATACLWYKEGHDLENSGEQCWNAIWDELRNGGIINYNPGGQKEFSISVEDDKIVVRSSSRANKNTVAYYYKNSFNLDSIQRKIAERLESLSKDNLEDAWAELSKEINQTSTPKVFPSYVVSQKQYLVIEEINRGNCAQIFGDLFQLLDRNSQGYSEYPIEADADLQQAIAEAFKNEEEFKLNKDLDIDDVINNYVSNYGETLSKDVQEGRILLLPPNLYIWATMNTSDQSLFPIDSAFKRRWDWQYIPITNCQKKWKIEVNGKIYDWWKFLVKINDAIESSTNSEDKKLGYYFCKAQDEIISAEKFVGKVIFYLWNDVFKDFSDESGGLFQDTDGSLLSFSKFYKDEGNGKPKIAEDKVELFMANLGVECEEEFSEEENADIDNDADINRFTLDGVSNLKLRNIAERVVSNYANKYPEMTALEIKNYFVELCKGSGIAHIVETEEEYHLRDNQQSQKRSATEITIPNGEKIYVSTQWRAKNPTDNFYKFMEIVNENGLGIIEQI